MGVTDGRTNGRQISWINSSIAVNPLAGNSIEAHSVRNFALRRFELGGHFGNGEELHSRLSAIISSSVEAQA
jgi:hypothetical protein